MIRKLDIIECSTKSDLVMEIIPNIVVFPLLASNDVCQKKLMFIFKMM